MRFHQNVAAESLSGWGLRYRQYLKQASRTARYTLHGPRAVGLWLPARGNLGPKGRDASPLTFLGFLTFKEHFEPEPEGPSSVDIGFPSAATALCRPRANFLERSNLVYREASWAFVFLWTTHLFPS